MQLGSAQALVEAAQESGLEVGLRETYSGRGMVGHTTVAVTLERDDLLAVVAVAAGNLKDAVPPSITFDEFVDDMRRLQQDSMGHGIVVY